MDKIYFAASIRGGREDVELYLKIANHLKRYGQVLTEYVADKGLTLVGEDGLSDREIHDRDMNWLSQSNVVVAEVTKASLGVGYEIGRIVERNLWIPQENRKRILCLYRPQIDRRLFAMINGSNDVTNAKYGVLEEAIASVDKFFNSHKR